MTRAEQPFYFIFFFYTSFSAFCLTERSGGVEHNMTVNLVLNFLLFIIKSDVLGFLC